MIEKERDLMAALVADLTCEYEADQTEAVASIVLNKSVSLKRGLVCGRRVSELCVDCVEVKVNDLPICEYREQQIAINKAEDKRIIMKSIGVVGTTLFTVDV